MSIQSGYKKVKDYILESSGYKLLSRWTSSNTVEFDDGQTAETKVGAVKGITSSTTATDAGYAASATQMNPNVSGSLAAKVDALDKSMVQKGKRIAPLKVSQKNMTVHDTVIYELPLLNIVFMSVTFSINSGGNIQLFVIENKYRPVEKSKLLISNSAVGATVYTDGKIAYDSDGHGLTLGTGTYTMIGMYKYFV